MRHSLRIAISAVVLQTVACGGESAPAATGNTGGASNACPAGSERCDCYGNSSCNAGLECLSNLCVAAATGGSPSTSGAAPNNLAGGVVSIGSTASVATAKTGVGGVTNTGGTPAIGGASMTVAAGGNPTAAGATGVPTAESQFVNITPTMWDQINSDACSGWAAEALLIPTSVEFIVDTSGSMRDVSANTLDGRDKWEITRTALENTLETMPRLTSVGLLLWPNMMTVPNSNTDCAYCNYDGIPDRNGVGQCVNVKASVPIDKMGAVDSAQRTSLTLALDSVEPAGGTPMSDAYNYALSTTYGDPLLLGRKYAVLITDGQPTIQLGCMGTGEEKRPVDYTPVTISIQGALTNAPHVKTFVVGSPGSEHASFAGDDGRAWLSDAAQAGGTSPASDCKSTGVPNYCHYDLTTAQDFATGLDAALQDIANQITGCHYFIGDTALQGQVLDPDKTNVIYQVGGSSAFGDMKLIGKASAPSCPEYDGWFMDPTDSSGQTIQLCPNTCAKVQQDAGAVVSIRGGCDLLPIIN